MNGKAAKRLRKKVKEILLKHNVSLDRFDKQYKVVKKAYKAGIVTVMLLLCSLSYADSFRIPFSCYPKEVQKDFQIAGYKLDLSPNDRTEESWGFIESRGSHYFIHTYRPAVAQDFEVIQSVAFKEVS